MEDCRMAHLFIADEGFGSLGKVVLAGFPDDAVEVLANDFCDGGFAVDGMNARGAIETVIDGNSDIRHVVAPEEVRRKENGPAAWAAGPWFFSAYF
jgi:hypothetical protein